MKFQIIYDGCEQIEIETQNWESARKKAIDYCFESFHDFDADLVDVKEIPLQETEMKTENMTIAEMTEEAYKDREYNKLEWVQNKLIALEKEYMRFNDYDATQAEYYSRLNNETLCRIEREEISFFQTWLRKQED